MKPSLILFFYRISSQKKNVFTDNTCGLTLLYFSKREILISDVGLQIYLYSLFISEYTDLKTRSIIFKRFSESWLSYSWVVAKYNSSFVFLQISHPSTSIILISFTKVSSFRNKLCILFTQFQVLIGAHHQVAVHLNWIGKTVTMTTFNLGDSFSLETINESFRRLINEILISRGEEQYFQHLRKFLNYYLDYIYIYFLLIQLWPNLNNQKYKFRIFHILQ